MIQTYNALGNQNIYDICLMTYGSLDYLFKLINDNNFGSINNYPAAGQSFTWDDTLVFNQQVNISNSQAKVNYCTASNITGNIIFDVVAGGPPLLPPPIHVTPVPSPPPGNNSVIVVEHGDSRLGVLDGILSYKALTLEGKSDYLVGSTTLGKFFWPEDIYYNAEVGGLVAMTPGGFTFNAGDQLLILPKVANTGLPVFPDRYTDVINAGDGRLGSSGGDLTITDRSWIGLSGVRVFSTSIGFFLRSEDVSFDTTTGTVTVLLAGFTLSGADQLIVYKNILNPDV
jgi:hypothetical protein